MENPTKEQQLYIDAMNSYRERIAHDNYTSEKIIELEQKAVEIGRMRLELVDETLKKWKIENGLA